MTSQLRLVNHGRRVWTTDLTAVSSAPADFTLAALPSNTILSRYDQAIGLMPYVIQSVDQALVEIALYGVMELGKEGADDTMYSAHLIANAMVATFDDAVPGLVGGIVSDSYSFSDSITDGSVGGATAGDMLVDFQGGTAIRAIRGMTQSASPCFITIRNLGPFIGVIPRLLYVDSSISAFNMLKFTFSPSFT